MADQALIRHWLTRLGRFTVSTLSEAEASEFVEEMAPMLAMRFSDACFNGRSLEHVAAECTYLPSYGEIVRWLRDWRDHVQHDSSNAERLTDQSTGLTAKAHAWVQYYRKREAEGFQPLREANGALSRPDITDWPSHTLSTIRRQSEEAYQYIMAELQGRAA